MDENYGGRLSFLLCLSPGLGYKKEKKCENIG